MTQVSDSVRPTKRCLTDLDLPLPDLSNPLDEIDHPVVATAQSVPEQRDAGGAQRILSLNDRVWFKVKTGDQRAVVIELRGDELPDGLPPRVGAWWIGAAGRLAWRREMKRIVVRLIATSLTTGHLAVAEFRQHRVKALVRADNGHEAYLAIIAEGIPDPEVFALLLDCVPGVSADDWQPEPSPIAEMKPSPGEVIWSTLFPTEIASAILELEADSSG